MNMKFLSETHNFSKPERQDTQLPHDNSDHAIILNILYTLQFILAQVTLSINSTLTLDTSNLISTAFRLPQTTTSKLSISIALCGGVSDGTRFFVTNNSAISDPSDSSDSTDVFEIVVNGNGFGNFTILGDGGGNFAISKGTDSMTLEVGVSDGEPIYELLEELPLFGDTTANQALIFSPAFQPPNITEPTYPNYTLPSADQPFSDFTNPPTVYPNFTLLVGPTASFPDFNTSSKTFSDGSPLTACALKSRTNITFNSNTSVVETTLILRDSRGWRTQWLFGGLQPTTNYTAFVIQDDTKVSGPIDLTTKSAFFSCPLVHSLPYCPEVSYSVPLPFPDDGSTAYTSSNLPTNVSDPLLSYLTNFTQSLLTFACGRDWYSPLMTCSDCQSAYRTWLCTVQLPRCGESSSSTTTASVSPSSTSTKKKRGWKRNLFRKRDDDTQVVLSTTDLTPAFKIQNSSDSSSTRNPNLPALSANGGNWTELLPCLETCYAVDRACPSFLGIACPVPRFNAAQSYGVGYIDGDAKDPGGAWLQNGGKTGVAQDRWGNVWCNGPGLVLSTSELP